ncbi:MAG TPA: GNAT family N-acetyltransferase, partial [Gaiellales bacterium]|nr:GNAT family N-acetyltransferase [Gaiellales bacterium]
MRPLRADDAAVCDTIVASLPHHFGEAGGRADCARAVRSQAGLVVSTGGEVAGFLTWRAWYGTSVEITWMAVRAGCRRSGLGTALIQSLVAS